MIKSRKTNKKGFTIVELVIVIAVIAILAAVLIPTFSNVIKKANRSNDIQTVRNLNEKITLYISEYGKDSLTSMQEVVEVVEENGYVFNKLDFKSDLVVAWHKDTGYLVLIDEEEEQVMFIGTNGSETVNYDLNNNSTSQYKASDFFVTVNAVDYNEKTPYSVYATGSGWDSEITCSNSFDMGDSTGIEVLKYKNNGDAQSVIIRTNSLLTEFVVDAPKDLVCHYGYAGSVVINNVAQNSYEEYGTVGRLSIAEEGATGHVDIKGGATVFQLEQEKNNENTSVTISSNSTVYDKNGAKIASYTEKSQTICSDILDQEVGKTCNHENGTSAVSDGISLFEFCNCCGYTLVTVNDTLKRTLSNQDSKNVITEAKSYFVYNIEETTAAKGGTVDEGDVTLTVDKAVVTNTNQASYCSSTQSMQHKLVYTACAERDEYGRYQHKITCSNPGCTFEAIQTCDLNSETECKHCGRTFEAGAYTLNNTPLNATFNNDGTVVNGVNLATAEHLILPENVTTIADNAYGVATNLRFVVIPQTVTTLGQDIFRSNKKTNVGSYNTSLVNVTFKQDANGNCSLTEIGAYAFDGCKNLTDLVLPESIISIGNYAFRNCHSLTTMNLENIQTLGEGAFNYCTGFETLELGEDLEEIGPYCFKNCAMLKNIDFSKCTNLEYLGYVNQDYKSVFENCYSLKELDLTNCTKLKVVPQEFCKYCVSLNTVKLPNTITTIKKLAFQNCNNLHEFTIPASVTKIEVADDGKSIFDETYNLTEYTDLTGKFPNVKGKTQYGALGVNGETIDIITKSSEDEETQYVRVGDFIIRVIDETVSEVIDYIGDIEEDNYVITLPEYETDYYCDTELFSQCYIASVSFANDKADAVISYESIVKKIKFTDNVIARGDCNSWYWYGLEYLEEIELEETSPYLSLYEGVLYEKDFSDICLIPNQIDKLVIHHDVVSMYSALGTKPSTFPNLTKVTFDEGSLMKNIGIELFTKFTALTEIDFTNAKNLESIGDYAFANTALVSITIPETVTSLGRYIFHNCTNLTEFTILFDSETNSLKEQLYGYHYLLFKNCPSLKTINFPDTLTDMPDYLLSSYDNSPNTGLETFTIPAGLKTISYTAFQNFPNLTNIDCSKNDNFSYADGILYNKDKTKIILVLDWVTDFVVPDGIVELDDKLFMNNKKITSVTITKDVKKIGNYTFKGCTNLKTVTFVDDAQIEFIGGQAFYGTAITSIAIPESVKKIGGGAFYECNNLTDVDCQNEDFYYGDDKILFNNDSKEIVFIPPTITNVVIPDGVTSIPDHLFEGYSKLESITIPASVTYIGDYAFYECKKLTTVTLAEGSQIEYIGDYAFYYCRDLESFAFDNCRNVKYIGDHSFYYCHEFTKVTLDNYTQLEEIGPYAFYNLSLLTAITIPSTVKTIGDHAIYGNYNIKTIQFGNGGEVQLESIGKYAFYRNKRVYSFNFEDCVNLKTIGDNAFYECFFIISDDILEYNPNPTITIPASVTTIGYRSFYNCKYINSFIFAEGSQIESIGEQAFSYCISITSMVLPTGLTAISNNLFTKCEKLMSVTIPSTVTSIGTNIFNLCNTADENFKIIYEGSEADFAKIDKSLIWYGTAEYLVDRIVYQK